jgi:transcription elongation factor GreA
MSTHNLSRAAYERLTAELEDLTTRGRIEVAEEIELARAEGDLKENAGYHAAKDKQGHMEGRIRQLEHLLENAEVVEEGAQTVYTMIYAGDSPDEAERYVVGSQEERAGLPDDVTIVGPASPLGTALQGMTKPGTLEYEGPAGLLTVEILTIEEI